MKRTGVGPDRGKVISIAIKNEKGRFCSAYRLCQVHRPLATGKLRRLRGFKKPFFWKNGNTPSCPDFVRYSSDVNGIDSFLRPPFSTRCFLKAKNFTRVKFLKMRCVLFMPLWIHDARNELIFFLTTNTRKLFSQKLN